MGSHEFIVGVKERVLIKKIVNLLDINGLKSSFFNVILFIGLWADIGSRFAASDKIVRGDCPQISL